MSVTVATPAGQDEPQDAAPAEYIEEQPEPVEEAPAAPGIKDRIEALRGGDSPVRAHLRQAAANTRSWLAATNVTDGQLTEELIEQRTRAHQSRETELRRQLARISERIVAAKRAEVATDHNDIHRDGPAVIALKGQRELIETQLREHQNRAAELAQAPTDGDVARARWGKKAGRAAMLVGGVVGGGIILPAQDPRLLLLSLPAAAVALWRAGAVPATDPAAAPEQAGPAPAEATAVPGAADAAWPAPQAIAGAAEDQAAATVAGVLPADPNIPPSGTFPIAGVSSPQWAGECIRRALVKEGVPVADLFDVARQPWGWTCKVRISEGTPAVIIKAAEKVETLLDLEAGRFIPTPTRRRAVIDLKVAEHDPFDFVPAPPYRAPLSGSILDRPVLGYSMDARPLEMSLYGAQGAIVAGAGGGKSANIRTIAEWLTSCHDTVLVSLDPSGVGLGPLGDAVALSLTDKDEIEVFLRGMHKVSLGRTSILARERMGTEWKPSSRWPALVAIGDEWPQNTDGAKEAGVDVQLTGRKVCVQLLLASQFATQDYVGSAIISNLSLQMLGPCRQADVTATFGAGALDDGWLPNRLVPKQAQVLNDVGRFFLRGGGYAEPVIWKGNWYDDDTCAELAKERAAAGVPQLDEESLKFGGREFASLFERRGTAAVAARSADRILADVVAVLRAEGLDRARTEKLAEMLKAHHGQDYAGITGTEVGDRLRAAGAGGAVKIGAVDGRTNANGYRLADLTEALDASS